LSCGFSRAGNLTGFIQPFFAEYDPTATWLDQLKTVFGVRFFFEEQFEGMYAAPTAESHVPHLND